MGKENENEKSHVKKTCIRASVNPRAKVKKIGSFYRTRQQSVARIHVDGYEIIYREIQQLGE
jgi:hypothetical protein